MLTKHLNYGHSVQATGFFSFPKAVPDPLYSPSQWISEPTKTWLESFFEKKNSICIDQSAIENSTILLKCATDLQPLKFLCTIIVWEYKIIRFLQSVEVPLLKNQQSSTSQPLPVCCRLPWRDTNWWSYKHGWIQWMASINIFYRVRKYF